MRSDAPLITCFVATNAEQVALSPGGCCRRPPARCCTQRLVRLTSKILQITLGGAFVLREFEELGTEEICKILDLTRTNLGVLLHGVRNRLRECLETKGIEP